MPTPDLTEIEELKSTEEVHRSVAWKRFKLAGQGYQLTACGKRVNEDKPLQGLPLVPVPIPPGPLPPPPEFLFLRTRVSFLHTIVWKNLSVILRVYTEESRLFCRGAKANKTLDTISTTSSVAGLERFLGRSAGGRYLFGRFR